MVFDKEELDLLRQAAEEPGFEELSAGFDEGFMCLEKAAGSETEDILFGEKEEPNLRTEYFYFLWNAVEKQLTDVNGIELFSPGAMKECREAFIDTLAGLWYDQAKEAAEELCGKMPFPYKEWLLEGVVPAIYSGKHFHCMAQRYPVLALQAANVCVNYAAHLKEIIEAVSKLPELISENGPVVNVSASESDWHDHCRSVHIITFKNGERIVYKPHSMSVDRGFTKWLDTLCELGGIERFPMPKSVDCAKGSVCSFIRHDPLSHPEDAALFYERMGFLMGAVHMLCGYDMHAENIIACGAFPMPVDMETVLLVPDTALGEIRGRKALPSIAGAGFLPMLNTPPGISSSGADSLTSTFDGSINLPYFGEKKFCGEDFSDEICKGYQRAFAVLWEHQNRLCDVFFDAFRGSEIRLVLRSTSNYIRLLNFFETPENLKSSSAYLGTSSRIRGYGSNLSDNANQMISKEEREALLRLDVPKFDQSITDKDLKGLWDQMSEMDDSFVRSQTEVIRFALKRIYADKSVAFGGNYPEEKTKDDVHALTGRMMRFLDGEAVPIVESSTDKRYYSADKLGHSPFLLEGGLGVFIALGSYALAFSDEQVLDFLKEKKGIFTDMHMIGSGMSMKAVGLADGLGGLIRGLSMGLSMGLFSVKELVPVFDALYRDVMKLSSIRFLSNGLFHGASGLLYALKRVPAELIREGHNEIVSLLEQKCIENPEDELFSDVPDHITGNNTFRYGNAGMLYRLVTSGNGDDSSVSDLKAVLGGAVTPVDGADYPDGHLYTGFFSGMSGILYSLSVSTGNENVPRL